MSSKSIEQLISDLPAATSEAIRYFWETRQNQIAKQLLAGRTDAGARGAVTGGAQMDAFITLLTDLLQAAGVSESDIYRRQRVELPGFYRPTKEWDLLVVKNGRLLVVVEAKSQVAPSFGNNFNNRTEEAIGSAVDLWTAYREGAFNTGVRPWLGYLFVLEQCPSSMRPVGVKQSHFSVFPEFVNASYGTRYEIFCRKLVAERNYDAATFLLTDKSTLDYSEPSPDLRFELFVRSMLGHVIAFEGAE